MKTIDKLISYFNVGIVPNSIGASNIGATVLCAAREDMIGLVANLIFGAYNTALGVLKYKEYKKVKRALEEHGFDERLVETMAHSWCQRHAARLAAEETGSLFQFNEFIRKEGYRWYHVLPR